MSLTKVAYDRHLIADRFRAPEFIDGTISGIGMDLEFDRKFTATPDGSEPAGAHELQQQVRVSYDHTSGLQFHCADRSVTYAVGGFDVTIEISPGYSEGVNVTEATFYALLGKYRERFRPDGWLQNLSYSLIPSNGGTH